MSEKASPFRLGRLVDGVLEYAPEGKGRRNGYKWVVNKRIVNVQSGYTAEHDGWDETDLTIVPRYRFVRTSGADA